MLYNHKQCPCTHFVILHVAMEHNEHTVTSCLEFLGYNIQICML